MGQPRLRDVELTDRGTGHRLAASFTTDHPVPTTGTVLYSIFAGSAADGMGYQLGVKLLDGQPIAHFVFDHVHAQQSNLDGDVTVEGTTVTATFPADQVPRLGESFDWSATLHVEGEDVHSLPRRTFGET